MEGGYPTRTSLRVEWRHVEVNINQLEERSHLRREAHVQARRAILNERIAKAELDLPEVVNVV